MRDIRGYMNQTENFMENLRKYILKSISSMIEDQKVQNISPIGITIINLKSKVANDIKITLNELCKDKVLEYYKTINSIAFKPKDA